ncbi:MAG TPA: prephenate dehydratase domain-containing protein [Pyrinomonadaceae bacterium]|nr:prephenate dehydratase domain-containing protein [Pyrinomonadaceae bacterium]
MLLIRKPRVAFQGERGAFSEEAALKLLGPEIELVPRKTFEDLFDSFDRGMADYLLAPVENTIAGIVQASVDLLNESSVKVLDEIEIRIEQHLIGCTGSTLETIENVQSHAVALAQCKRFLETHARLKPVVADDTAGSVAEVVRRRDPKLAAIAGERAAEVYGATILRRSIQDQTENFTRFVLLSAPIQTNLRKQSLLVKEVTS